MSTAFKPRKAKVYLIGETKCQKCVGRACQFWQPHSISNQMGITFHRSRQWNAVECCPAIAWANVVLEATSHLGHVVDRCEVVKCMPARI